MPVRLAPCPHNNECVNQVQLESRKLESVQYRKSAQDSACTCLQVILRR